MACITRGLAAYSSPVVPLISPFARSSSRSFLVWKQEGLIKIGKKIGREIGEIWEIGKE
jgi:hypothetical protein